MDEKYLMESQFSLDSLASASKSIHTKWMGGLNAVLVDDERQGEQPEQPSASEQRSELTVS
eukprot:m.33877 g.33877  ORF g.33877 m.33877 type:complete len:61 (+) comp31924_c0_seq4:539-721(+)